MAFIDGGDSFRQATSLGTAVLRKNALATIRVEDQLSFSKGETVDWFRFRVRGRASSKFASTTLSFASNPSVTSFSIYKQTGNKVGKLVGRLDPVNNVKIIKPLTAGKYFVKVSGSPSASTTTPLDEIYTGSISTFVPPS